MKFRRKGFLFFLVVSLALFPIRATAQNNHAQRTAVETPAEDLPDDESAPVIFPLIPLLETAFNGELRWRPDWPDDIPPDGFSLTAENLRSGGGSDARWLPFSFTLSNGSETFSFKRDEAGRLREFPFFSRNGRLSVKADYDDSGAMLSMNVRAAACENEADGEGADSGVSEDESAESEISEITWDIEFPPDFFPYSESSPGGDFLPVKVSCGDTDFFVFFFESQAFFSETWYDSGGNPLVFFRANVRPENGSWTVQALHSWDAKGRQSEEYSFDAGGNISGIRSPEGTFSALYTGSVPRYWERQPVSGEAAVSHAALQWDERGFLLSLSFEDAPPAAGSVPVSSVETALLEVNPPDAPAAEEAEPPPVEYRYKYELDAGGNWISRQDIAIIDRFGVFVPRPGRSWTRRISFAGN
ncbi:MAG: hypothetical protein LBS37_08625 [Treponema sp.]|jgi:hypothetical protein|nr:hypothetical protein [Treponema sp.]